VIDVSGLQGRWRALVEAFAALPTGIALDAYLRERRAAGAAIYPPQPLRGLELTPFESVRVVILGQDPYHGAGQAHGLAFSVPDGVPLPPSLRNILAELSTDCGCARPASGNLQRWAAQGVLLLNTVLTVEDGKPASHAQRGWETLTDALIAALATDAAPKAFLLWGAHAQAKLQLIENESVVPAEAGTQSRSRKPLGSRFRGNDEQPQHRVLTANHPSPLSARRPPQPFLGCRHFSQANAFLAARGRGSIDWCG